MPPVTANPRASGCQAATKSVAAETAPAAHEAFTRNDEAYVYIRVPGEKMAPVGNGLTETVQHEDFHSPGPQNLATYLHAVPMQPAATVSQQWRGDSSTIYSPRASVVQPGRCREVIVNSA